MKEKLTSKQKYSVALVFFGIIFAFVTYELFNKAHYSLPKLSSSCSLRGSLLVSKIWRV